MAGLLVAALVLALVVRQLADGPDEAPEPEAPARAGANPEGEQPAPQPAAAPGTRRGVTVYWPAADAAGLRARTASVEASAAASEQARAAVELLLGAPPDAGVVAPLPKGTRVRALFLTGDGVAVLDLSREAQAGPGGSTGELLTVYSLVNTITRSFSDVRAVQVVVDGQEVESLTGHLDLRRPLRFDPQLVVP